MKDKFEFLHDNIAKTLKSGAQYADIFIQSGEGHSVHFEDGKIDEISSSTADGAGSRIIAGGKTFYAHAPGNGAETVGASFEECAASAFRQPPSLYSSEGALMEEEEAIEQPAVDFFREIDEKIKKESPHIRQSSYRYTTSHRRLLIVKPDGSVAFDRRYYCSFAAQLIVEKDGLLQTGSERRCMSLPASGFWEGFSPLETARAALRRALLMLEARPCPAGKMNVLMAGEAGGTIIHEACGHGLEADIVEKDYSVYRGRIGEQVAHESVTMLDEAAIPGLYGSYNFDDEGTLAGRTLLIENGILRGYLTDVISSQLYGLPLTGNGRRESYRCIPVPRMSNTYLLPGNDDMDTMLARADKGLYVRKMGGGEVDPTSGDFVFYVTEGYLIEKGKISSPVRGAILTGNGPEALRRISALGNNLIMDPGICGKSGQGVPVTDGQPSMLIEGLTVGGSEA
ncbi:MAG: TldD/PmbA family protein [Synergistaceae bacterium]|nr:TldD/PmbA family protein [Synergistaceae bacterium]